MSEADTLCKCGHKRIDHQWHYMDPKKPSWFAKVFQEAEYNTPEKWGRCSKCNCSEFGTS